MEVYVWDFQDNLQILQHECFIYGGICFQTSIKLPFNFNSEMEIRILGMALLTLTLILSTSRGSEQKPAANIDTAEGHVDRTPG